MITGIIVGTILLIVVIAVLTLLIISPKQDDMIWNHRRFKGVSLPRGLVSHKGVVMRIVKVTAAICICILCIVGLSKIDFSHSSNFDSSSYSDNYAAPTHSFPYIPHLTPFPTMPPLPTFIYLEPSSGTGNCNPSYPDVCLQNGIGDYDCAGGSGNGPNYVHGPIRVIGSDPFDLDRDGDGWGCE